MRNPDSETTPQRMIAAIDAAKAAGDTLGGQFVVRVDGVPVGIGSNRQPDQRLDGILAGALMGMQTAKSVEIGLGARSRVASRARRPTTRSHSRTATVVRASNRAGGIEGGMSNGQPIVVRVSVKPIPTLVKALPSVNLHARTDAPATIVRSDVCVVPAAAIVGEAMVRLALTAPVLEKYGGDSMEETLDNLRRSRDAAAALFEGAKPKTYEAAHRARRIHGFGQIDDRQAAGAQARMRVLRYRRRGGARARRDLGYLLQRRRSGVSPLRARGAARTCSTTASLASLRSAAGR